MLSFSISYQDSINFHYFADTIERWGGIGGWKEAQRQGDFMDNSNSFFVFAYLVKPNIELLLFLGMNLVFETPPKNNFISNLL
jgi:hypothetical protein